MNEKQPYTVTDFVIEVNKGGNPGITTLIMEALDGHFKRKVFSNEVLTPDQVAKLRPLVSNIVIDDAVDDAVSRME